MLVTNCFSTQTSYENQTKKAITNKFIQEAMTEFLKEGLEIYFIENKAEADKIAEQVLINKRSREQAEKARLNIKKKLSGNIDLANRVAEVRGLPHQGCVPRVSCISSRAIPHSVRVKQGRDSEFPGHHAGARQDPQLPESRLRQDFQERHHHRPSQGPRLRCRGARQRRQRILSAFDLERSALAP